MAGPAVDPDGIDPAAWKPPLPNAAGGGLPGEAGATMIRKGEDPQGRIPEDRSTQLRHCRGSS